MLLLKLQSNKIYLLLSSNFFLFSPEAISTGIIPKSFVCYTVKTSPFEWVVKRRFNDFFWLRETLHKLHPGVFVIKTTFILFLTL